MKRVTAGDGIPGFSTCARALGKKPERRHHASPGRCLCHTASKTEHAAEQKGTATLRVYARIRAREACLPDSIPFRGTSGRRFSLGFSACRAGARCDYPAAYPLGVRLAAAASLRRVCP